MVRYLYEGGAQMLPVMAKHSLFCLRFNISRQQNALLTVVNFYYAGVIVTLSRIIFRGPVNGEG